MPEMENEILEQTEDADITKENESDSELDPKTLLAQKKHFKDKFKEEEEKRISLEKELNALKSQPKAEVKSDDSNKRLEAIEFALAHPEIESKTSMEILEVARAKGIKPSEALELPYFKSYIKEQQEARSTQAISNSNRSPKFTPEKPVSEMSAEEHRKYWEQLNKK